MTVIASVVYQDGRRSREIPLDEARPPEQLGEFIWIGLHEPSAEEMQTVAKTFRLHPLAVEDAFNKNQMPKVEIYGDELFVIVKTTQLEGDKIRYGETAIFVGKSHIITVRHGSARAHTQLRSQVEASPQLLRQGPDYVLHAILDFIVDGYQPVVETIEDKVLEMEKQMLLNFLEREQIRRLFRMRRQVILFQRVLGPMLEVSGKLVHLELPCLDPESKPFFRDVLDHVSRVQSTVTGLREVITSVFEASNLLEQQRQGVITRQLASWAAILAVPTAVAGIYGMNFEHMPELKTEYGYYVVLGVIVTFCTILYWRFKKAKWL
jgi:magnesium transporter